MALYRSKTLYKAEPFVSDMGTNLVRVLGSEDNMVYAIVNESDFANMYELIPETPTEEPTPSE